MVILASCKDLKGRGLTRDVGRPEEELGLLVGGEGLVC